MNNDHTELLKDIQQRLIRTETRLCQMAEGLGLGDRLRPHVDPTVTSQDPKFTPAILRARRYRPLSS